MKMPFRVGKLAMLILLLLGTDTGAAIVSQGISLAAAENFFRQAAANMQAHDTSLAGIDVSHLSIASVQAHPAADGSDAFYVVQFSPQGWVIISADNAAVPVLGYSLTGSATVPPGDSVDTSGVTELLAHYAKLIDSVRAVVPTNPLVQELWDLLLAGSTPVADTLVGDGIQMAQVEFQPVYASIVVPPLLHTIWNQGSGWNMYAPVASGGPGGKAWAGCSAVSTSQVMKYHHHPSSGVGTRNGYDFAAATYDFDAMPDSTFSTESAKLLRHVGAAIDMAYSGRGSAGYTYKVAEALRNYFQYSNDVTYVRSYGTSTANWIAMLKSELDAGRPLVYEGFGNGSGHSFVVDGYNSSSYFHMNFGWSGYMDGWYSVSDITPGAYNFTGDQGAIKGIHPATYTPSTGQVLAGATATGEVFITGDLLNWVQFSSQPSWTKLAGTMASLQAIDLESDGKLDDLVGIGRDGSLYSSTNLLTWTKLRAYVKSVVVGDLDANGFKNDMAIVDNAGAVWVKIGAGAFTKVPGITTTYLRTIDLDGDGIRSDLMAHNTVLKKLYFTTDKLTWSAGIPAAYSNIQVLDVDKDGKEDDLVAVASTGALATSVDRATWQRLPGTMAQVVPADFDGDGVRSDLFGRAANGSVYSLSDTTWTQLTGVPALAELVAGDFNSDGKIDDLAGATSAGTVYAHLNGGDWYHLNGVYKALALLDVDGDGKLGDLVGVNTSGYPYYTTHVSAAWLGTVKTLVALDQDKDGKATDLAALDVFGSVLFSSGDRAWRPLALPEQFYRIISADLDGDGKEEGLVGIGLATHSIYLSSDLVSWTKISGNAEWVAMGDLDGEGVRNDLVVTNRDKTVWTSTDRSTLTRINGSFVKVVAMDLDGDGHENDLVGYNALYLVQKKLSSQTDWTNLGAASYRKELIPYDNDGDGVKESLLCIGKDGKSYATINQGVTWVDQGFLPTALWVGDLDGNGLANDFVGIKSDGKLYKRMAGASAWTYVSSSYKTIAVGDFGLHLDAQGTLAPQVALATKAASPAHSVGPGPLGLRLRGSSQVEVSDLGGGPLRVWWADAKGRSVPMFQGNAGTGGMVLVTLGASAQGFGWVVAKDSRGNVARIPVAR